MIISDFSPEGLSYVTQGFSPDVFRNPRSAFEFNPFYASKARGGR